jgi:hypothetical protein
MAGNGFACRNPWLIARIAERGNRMKRTSAKRDVRRDPTGREIRIWVPSPDFIRGYFHVFPLGRRPISSEAIFTSSRWEECRFHPELFSYLPYEKG